ncbi:MAG: hypothetical protein JST53_16735 [Actinobacteria bacterium]|nr:hypothetical protein [Actinomycetota bacterium]
MHGSRYRRRPTAKLAVGLAAALLVAAGASYAAVRPAAPPGPQRHSAPASPIKSPATIPIVAAGSTGLRIVEHPPPISTHPTARFRVVAAGEPELHCRLDRGPIKPCASSVFYRGLAGGDHTFLVAAQRPGRRAVRADFGWRVLEPEPFEVEPRPGSIGPLYPGAAPLPIRIVISNPNEVAITLTALKVTASGGAPGCDPATNVALTTPALGRWEPRIPAGGSLILPSAIIPAPTIALRELGVNQDACKGAKFSLSFSGSAGA